MSYSSLLEKYNQTKEELDHAEKSIKRITARHPDAQQNPAYTSGRASKFRPGLNSASENINFMKKRSTFNRDIVQKVIKNECESEESSSDEPPSKKPSMPSSIVAKHGLAKSRRATIEEQNANARIKARNRRMFGTLIGTLEKFQNEEKKRQPVESKRAKIEQKVEAATEEEKEKFRQEKKNLLITRQMKKAELRCLEKKIERTESHEEFVKNYEFLCNFIRTRVKPQLFFLPALHTPATKKRLADSQRKIKEVIEKMKTELQNDLDEIEEMYRKDEYNIQIGNDSNFIQATGLEQNNEIDNQSKILDLEKTDGLVQLVKTEKASPRTETPSEVIPSETEENRTEVTDFWQNNDTTNENKPLNSEMMAGEKVSQLSGNGDVSKVDEKQEKKETDVSENSETVGIELDKNQHSNINKESKVDGQQDTILEENQGDENSGKKLSELYIDYFEPIYD